ncbi:MAG: recombinase family protein, partial [Syntrophomonadaceae bacterium]|nr:recombinase family protein [Syntrophomonadaceae bacterium]
AELEALRITRREKYKTLESFIREIETRRLLIEEFDKKLWIAIVDKVTALPGGKLKFNFKNGTEIEA